MDKLVSLIISGLPNGVRLSLVLFLIIINYGAEFLVKRAVLKVYHKTNSPEEAVNKLRIYNQYFLVVLQIITIVAMEFLVVKYSTRYGKAGRIVFMTVASFVFLMVINIGQLLIINKTYQRIRGTTQSLFNQVRDLALTFLLFLGPAGLIGTMMLFADEIKVESDVVAGMLTAAIPIGMMFLFNLILPFFYPKILKASALEDAGLRERLNQLFAKAGIKPAQFYQWPTKEKKVANALVVGLVKPKVFIGDYYLENAEPGEIEATIAHEIGHLKHKHLFKRLLYLVGGIAEVVLVGSLLDWYEKATGKEINIYLGLAILLGPFLLYISLGLLQYYRSQEKKADEFALEIGIKPEVMINALLKLGRLNHMVTKLKKLDERFQTHPSMARRIEQIEKISGYKYEFKQ
ncbi:MAG: M48 family metalloprotease [Firmicutes bacterium]|nr:M48 family metalloprotease [Bacillota bacterium]